MWRFSLCSGSLPFWWASRSRRGRCPGHWAGTLHMKCLKILWFFIFIKENRKITIFHWDSHLKICICVIFFLTPFFPTTQKYFFLLSLKLDPNLSNVSILYLLIKVCDSSRLQEPNCFCNSCSKCTFEQNVLTSRHGKLSNKWMEPKSLMRLKNIFQNPQKKPQNMSEIFKRSFEIIMGRLQD